MLRSKVKNAARIVFRKIFNFLIGSGIGKIPGVFRVFIRLNSFFGQDELSVKIDGQKFYLRSDISPSVEESDIEPHVSSLFRSMLKEGMVVVDVGAAMGFYTLLAAKRIGNSGLCYSFEPDPYCFKTLVKNINVNSWNNVKPFQLALSDRNGKRRMRLFMGFTSSKNIGGTYIANVVTLDSFLKTTDIDIVKIDVEGAEYEVLRGMKKILELGKVKIICEVHPSHLLSLGYSTTDILDILKQYNYSIYLINEDSGLTPVTTISNERIKHYLFTKENMG